MATLAEIDLAIKEITDNGQSFTLGDMQYTAANLSALIALRETMLREEQRSTGNRPVFRAVNMGSAGY